LCSAIIPTRLGQFRIGGPVMLEPMQKASEDFQKMGKDNYDAMVRSYGELNKGFQAIASRWTDFSKRSFEDSTRAWEQMIGAKSIEQAFEIQTNYVKKAYDNWMAEMSKIGEMYSSAARDAYKPVEQAMAKKAA
jgi:phasin family protein